VKDFLKRELTVYKISSVYYFYCAEGAKKVEKKFGGLKIIIIFTVQYPIK
jgi:hypothetical protein